jgi:hypothetical protein
LLLYLPFYSSLRAFLFSHFPLPLEFHRHIAQVIHQYLYRKKKTIQKKRAITNIA